MNDLRQGFGEMQWKDGSKYKGQWDQGVQHGIGLMEFPDGLKKAGRFDKNVYLGDLESIEEAEEINDEEFKAEVKEALENRLEDSEVQKVLE